MNAAASKNQNSGHCVIPPIRKRGIKNLNSIESKSLMTEKIALLAKNEHKTSSARLAKMLPRPLSTGQSRVIILPARLAE